MLDLKKITNFLYKIYAWAIDKYTGPRYFLWYGWILKAECGVVYLLTTNYGYRFVKFDTPLRDIRNLREIRHCDIEEFMLIVPSKEFYDYDLNDFFFID